MARADAVDAVLLGARRSATSAWSTRSSRSAICSCSSSRRSITGAERGVAAAQVRERRCGPRACGGSVTDAAVGLAERAERPVVLADRHAVDERPHGGRVAARRRRPARRGRAAARARRAARRGRR